MTDIEINKSFDNDYFSYESHSCFCGIDVTNISPGVIEHTLKVQSQKSNNIYFAYSGEKGLCRTTATGSIREENLLNSVVSLPENDVSALLRFFENNGFLFKVSDVGYETLKLVDVMEVINRLKATVLLMNEIEAALVDYSKLVSLTMYLLLSPQVSVELSTLQHPYTTCKHFFNREIENASQLPEIDGQKEAFYKDTYTIKDTVCGEYELNIEEYNDVVSGNLYANRYPGYLDLRYRAVCYLYRNGNNLSRNKRLVIDFIFHYMKSVGVVSGVSFERGLEYYAEVQNHELMDEQLKKSAIFVAKIVLNEEINYNLSGIAPRYSAFRMGPTWKVPNLLSALYFSVFYLQPGAEVYRKCANPACNNHFVVKTTNGRKKYCSPNCRNATAQRNHRKKMKATRS